MKSRQDQSIQHEKKELPQPLNISNCSSFFYQVPKSKIDWETKLTSMHSHNNWLMESDIKDILAKKVVKNLENLHHNIENYFHFFKIFEVSYIDNGYYSGLDDTEIYLLSGEIPAIKCVNKEEWKDYSQIFFTTFLSGSIEAIRYLYNTRILSPKIHDYMHRTALHYAAMSGSITLMRYVFEELHIKPTTGLWGNNVLHFAAASGSVEAMKYAIEALGISPTSEDNQKRTALHYAAWRGSVEAMRYAYETLKIPLIPDNRGISLLHYAAWSGSVDAVRYVMELYRSLNMQIDPTIKDRDGFDVYAYADKSNNATEIKKILNLSGQDLEVKQQSISKISL